MLSSMISGSMKSQLIGYPLVGASAGLAVGMANNYFSDNLYGNSMNDPFLGSTWDFVLTGASLGGGAALISSGIKFQAQQMKIQRVNNFVEMGLSETSNRLLAISGK